MAQVTDLVFVEQSLIQDRQPNDYSLAEIAKSVSVYVEEELKTIETVEEAKELYAKTNGISSYIRKAIKDRGLKLKASNDLALSLIQVERWIGRWLEKNDDMYKGKSGKYTTVVYLPDLGLSANQSSRYQLAAQVPEDELLEYFTEVCEKGEQLTRSHIINWGKRIKKARKGAKEKAELARVEKELPPTHHQDCLYNDEWTSVWHGDAGNLSFIKDGTVDLIVTSPPYNIGPKSGNGRILWGGVNYSGHNDVMPEDEYQVWQVAVLDELWRVARPGASLFYNHKVRNRKGRGIHPFEWISKSKWTFRQQIIWDRGSTHNKEMSYFWPHDELIFWLTKGVEGVYLSAEGARMSTVWRFGFQTNSDHPAPFPKVLPARCIRAASKPGDLVLDPFGGSMTTCKAAKELKRKSLGVDISRDYVIKYSKYLTQGVLL